MDILSLDGGKTNECQLQTTAGTSSNDTERKWENSQLSDTSRQRLSDSTGYHVVVDCDLKQCFDTLNHDKLMFYLGQHIQDKAVLHFIRRSLLSGVIDLSGEFLAS